MASPIIQQIIYKFTADTSSAQAGMQKMMSESLHTQREAWKQSIYDEKSRAADRRATLAQERVEANRLAEGEKKLALQRLKIAKDEESAVSARNRAAIASRQAELRRQEIAELGVSGLDRMSFLGGLLPPSIQGAIAQGRSIAQNVASQTTGQPYSRAPGVAPTGGRIGGSLFSQVNQQQQQASAAATKAATSATSDWIDTLGNLGTIMGVAGLIGVTAALASSFGKLMEQMQSAELAAVSRISQTSLYARLFNLDREAARRTVAEEQRLLELQGRNLPVPGSAIAEVSSRLAQGGAARILGQQEFLRLIVGTETEPGFAALAALMRERLGNTITGGQTADFYNKVASGVGLQELRGTEFARTSGILPLLEQAGYDQASPAERIKLIVEAFEKIIPQEEIEELKRVPKSQISALNDLLYAPSTGVLGFLKQLDSLGGRTVFDTYSAGLQRSLKPILSPQNGPASFALDALNPFTAMGGFDNEGLGMALGRIVNSGVDAIIDNPLILSQFALGIGRNIGDFLGTINYFRLAAAVGALIMDVGIAVVGGLAGIVIGFLGSAGVALEKYWTGEVTKFISTLGRWFAEIFESLSKLLPKISPVIDKIAAARQSGQDYVEGVFFGGGAGGYVPNNLGGSALLNELLNKPAGSKLMVANSSEAILPPTAFRNLLGGSGRITIGDVNIFAAPGQNEESLAEAVIRKLEEEVFKARAFV